MDYYLINTSGKTNQFFANDQFGKTIIKENKDKIRPLLNTTSNEFLREIVALNIISLIKIRKVIVRKSCSIHQDNYHLVVNNTVDISKLV